MTTDLRTRDTAEPGASQPGLVVREPTRSDIPEIGALYFTAYEPGLVGEDVEEATIPPGLVRKILTKGIGLSEEEAKKLL